MHSTPNVGTSNLRGVASASLLPRGPGYDPRVRLKRRFVALRGGEDAIVLAFAWVNDRVRVRVLAEGDCSSEDVDRSIDAARRIAAADDDPSDFLAMIEGHPILGRIARRVDPRIASTPTVFESFSVAVIEQLVTTTEARASIRRLWRVAGAVVPNIELFAAPTAAAVRRVPLWMMHRMGIGARRAVTLHEGAGRGDALERLRAVSPETMIRNVQSLAGVGPWTAHQVARNGLGWADAVPIGDFHAPFAITEALGGPILRREEAKAADAAMLEVLAPFRPHRARVALILERYSFLATRQSGERAWKKPRVDAHRREPWRY